MAEGGNYKSIVSSSKRLMTDDDASSSVHQVVFNDDLLIEILLRLPLISLFFLKSVSKRWLSLITSPAFFNLHVTRFPNIQPLSGLFHHKTNSTNDHFQHDFVSLDSSIPPGSNVEVLQSCNGLVLCVTQTIPGKVYVYNTSNNMFKMLPPAYPDGLKSDRMRLAYDPKKSPHYKILHSRQIVSRSPRPPKLRIQIRIYSSETGCWRFGHTYPWAWFCGNFDMGVHWNDAIHWLDNTNWVMHIKLDVECPFYTTTQLPKTLDRNISYKELFESRGCLLLACAGDPNPTHLEIYEMKDGYSRWSMRSIVKYEDSSIAVFLKTWNMSTVGFGFNVLFIVMGEKEEESFVVMNLNGKVVKYNLLSKTLHMLCDIDRHLIKTRTFPFVASFA